MAEQKKTENQKTVHRTRPRTWRSKHQMSEEQLNTFRVTPDEVYQYLTEDLGVSDIHARGMMANMAKESEFDPGVEGDLANKKGSAAGLFQMRLDRREGMEKFAGPYWEDNWKKQVEYMVKEDAATKDYLAQQFKDVDEATKHFTEEVERPANAKEEGQNRTQFHKDWARFPQPKKLTDTISPTPTPASTPAPSASPVSSPSPAPTMQLHEAVDRATKPIAPVDEPDNTLQRRLASEGRVAGGVPKAPPSAVESGKKKDLAPEFAKAKDDYDSLRELYQQNGIDLDVYSEPAEFHYQVGEKIIKSPTEFTEYVDEMTKDVYNANLTSDDRAQYLSALATYEKARQKVTDAYDQSEKRLEMAQVIEIFGQALAQLAAGWYGLKHGIDMSGAQFKLSDWSDSYRRIAKKLDRELDTIEGKEKITRAEFKDKERAAEKAAADAEKRETRAYYTEKSDFESREGRRATQENRLRAEARRIMTTSVIEQNRNAAKDVRKAEQADNKQRQGLISSYKLKKAESERKTRDLTKDIDNLNKAYKAKKMEDVEFYLSKILELDPATVRDISGRGAFNLEDKEDIQPLIDAKKLQLETEQGIISDAYNNIINLQEGGSLPQSASDIDAELEAIRKRKQELLGQ